MNSHRSRLHTLALAGALLSFAALTSAPASAQQAWNENVITADPPTQCTSGQPITNCPITGFRFYRSATTDGGYAVIGNAVVPRFTHTNAPAGPNCYYVTAVSAGHGESGPSNTFCKTNTAPLPPPGPPNPPTNGRFVTVAAVTHSNINATPVVRILGSPGNYRAGAHTGLVPLGRVTQGPPLFTTLGRQWCRVEVGTKETYVSKVYTDLAAPCAARS